LLLQRQVLVRKHNRPKVAIMGEPGVAVLLCLLLYLGKGEGAWLLSQANHEAERLTQATLVEETANVLAVVPRGKGGRYIDEYIAEFYSLCWLLWCN